MNERAETPPLPGIAEAPAGLRVTTGLERGRARRCRSTRRPLVQAIRNSPGNLLRETCPSPPAGHLAALVGCPAKRGIRDRASGPAAGECRDRHRRSLLSCFCDWRVCRVACERSQAWRSSRAPPTMETIEASPKRWRVAWRRDDDRDRLLESQTARPERITPSRRSLSGSSRGTNRSCFRSRSCLRCLKPLRACYGRGCPMMSRCLETRSTT
jgi:hypothetical protein